jgi:hypothetical protein
MATATSVIRYRSKPKKKTHRRGGMTVPLSLIGGLMPMAADIVSATRVGGIEAALGHVSLCTTGYDPADGKWKPGFAMQKLYGPMFVAMMAHKLAGRLGINRMLGKAGVPLFRI